MIKPYYECHITFDGDPTMGAGVRQYATKHFNTRVPQAQIWDEMQDNKQVLENAGLRVTRCKIEKVLRDERYKS